MREGGPFYAVARVGRSSLQSPSRRPFSGPRCARWAPPSAGWEPGGTHAAKAAPTARRPAYWSGPTRVSHNTGCCFARDASTSTSNSATQSLRLSASTSICCTRQAGWSGAAAT
jgi:hypothetical protein